MSHVWTLSWFDRETERLAGEERLKTLSDGAVSAIVGMPADEILGGEWPIDLERAQRLERATGFKPALGQYDYFLGATAV